MSYQLNSFHSVDRDVRMVMHGE